MCNKLNICSGFANFSHLTIPMAGRSCSHYLNAFSLCLHVRYFLVHDTVRIDQRMCLVVSNLRMGSLMGMILAETLNGLAAIQRKEANMILAETLVFE